MPNPHLEDKMKILHVVSYFPPALCYGGVPIAAYLMAREQSKNHDVEVYTTDAGIPKQRNDINPGNMQVHYFRNHLHLPTLGLFITPGLVSHAIRNLRNFDIIHLHEYRSFQNVVVHRLARNYGVPFVVQPHGSLPRIAGRHNLKLVYDNLLGSSMLRDAARVLVLCDEEVKQCQRFRLQPNRVKVVPNGIDLADFEIMPTRGTFRSKYGIDTETSIVLFLGRIHEIKGLDTLLQAYSRSTKSGLSSHLVIAGPDYGFQDYLRSLAVSNGIQEHVTFTGPLYGMDKKAAFMDANVFVLPSWYETFPLTILEAYACSLPVIGSDVGAIPDLIEIGSTGLVFPAGAVQDLTNLLNQVLSAPETAEKMGRSAKQVVEQRYSINKAAKITLGVYRSVLGD